MPRQFTIFAAALGFTAAAILFVNRPRSADAEPQNNIKVGTDLAATAVLAQDGDWGAVKGRIIWGGDKAPPPEKIALPADNPATADCAKANKGQAPPDEKWVVNQKNKGIQNTFVWLADFENPKSQKPLPTSPKLKDVKLKDIVLDQPACHFIPHALALRQGQVLVVKNSAPFQHNFKWTGDQDANPGGNILLPPGGEKKIDNLVASRLPVQMECNIHPWMRGWIRVFSHPYFAVADENGAFEFKDAPAGKFRMMIWHGSAGWLGGVKGNMGRPIDIKAGAVTDLGDIAGFN